LYLNVVTLNTGTSEFLGMNLQHAVPVATPPSIEVQL